MIGRNIIGILFSVLIGTKIRKNILKLMQC
jgi:hypothetical protein